MVAVEFVVGRGDLVVELPKNLFDSFSLVGDIADFSTAGEERRNGVVGFIAGFAVGAEVPMAFGFGGTRLVGFRLTLK